MIHEKAWFWGNADDLVFILSKLPLIEFSEFDKAIRISSKPGSFSVANVWDQIRSRRPVVSRWKISTVC